MNQKLQVLIVEDNPADADFIREMLSQAGRLELLVKWVPRLSEALARLKRKDVDLILLDLGLPDSQGLQTLRTLQKTAPDVPVIVLTGTDDHELAVAAVRDGAQDYFIKGQVSGVPLVSAVRHALARQEAAKALRQSEIKFRSLFNNAAVGMFRTSLDGSKCLDANDKFLSILGRTREEVVGKPSAALWADPKEREAMVEILEAKGHVTDFECRLLNKGVEAINCLTSLKLDPETGILEGSIIDITGRKRAEAEILRRTVELAALNSLSRGVSSSLSMEIVVASALREMLNAVKTDAVFLFLREGERLVLGGIAPESGRERLGQIPGHGVGECICDLAMRQGQPLYVRDIFSDLRCLREECKKAGFRSLAVLPLRAGDEITGAIGLASATERDFEQQAGYLETLANAVSASLQNARLFAEAKRAEEMARQSREEFKALFDHAPVGYHELDTDGRIVRINQTELKMLGYTAEELLGQFVWELSADEARTRRAVLAKLAGEMPPSEGFERRLRRKDGSTIPVLINDRMLKRADGVITGMRGGVQDITERKRAEEGMRESQALYQSFVEQLPTPVFRKDSEGRFVMGNAHFWRLKGLKAEDLIGKKPLEAAAVKPAGQKPSGQTLEYSIIGEKAHEEIMRTGKIIETEEEYPREDGGKQFLHVVRMPVFDPTGRIIGTQGIQFDITERKQAEERIRKQAALLDAANDAIYVRAMDHTVTYWNNGAERLHGWTRAEALGRNILDLIKYEGDTFETASAALLTQGNWSGELQTTSKADKRVTVFCRWTLLRNESNRPKEVLVINSDITRQKQLEADYLRAQRMEGIGALAGGIAHDLNNILHPILMTAPLLRETIGDPDSREMLNTVEKCARRGSDIVKQLLTFARGKPGTRAFLSVRHLLDDMNTLMQATFPKSILLRVHLPVNLWPVLGDATQIHQALMNICVNARDAMPDGGALTLAAENLTLDEAFAAMMPGAKPGHYICVSVTDTGMGISPENLDRIFDPFFTTKDIGKGTGLGLAMVLGIVRGHGGFVRVNSQAAAGTTFELYLPASPEAKATALPERETLPPRAGGELILVVDDEADVRRVVQHALEKHGYRVISAVEGGEALSLFGRHRAEIKAVLTDMMMPGMDGPSLVQALRHLEPKLPIIGMTGVAEKAEFKKGETLGLLALLTKPFNSAELLNTLHQVRGPCPHPTPPG